MSAPSTPLQWESWFQALRLRERKALEDAPPPAPEDQRFRFSEKEALLPFPDVFKAAPAPDESVLQAARARAKLVRHSLAQLVFVNGHLAEASALPESWIQQGARFLPLSQAVAQIPALVAPLLFQSVHHLGSAQSVHWHRAGALDGAFLYVPNGVHLEGELSVVHFTHGADALLRAHTLCLLEAGASANLVETSLSLDEGAALVSAETEVFLGEGACLNRCGIQYFNTQTRCARRESAVLAKNARFKAFAMLLGSRLDRHESAVRLAGEGANARLFSVGAAAAGQCFDQRTFQDHLAPGASSDLLYKNGVFGGGKTVFAGMIDVKPGAQGTQAYQSNRNLLMDADAKSFSLPGLEIEANDVKCSHGATNGPIDEEQLFYLRARGIGPKEARALLLEGFLAETADRAGETANKDVLLGSLSSKLQTALHVG